MRVVTIAMIFALFFSVTPCYSAERNKNNPNDTHSKFTIEPMKAGAYFGNLPVQVGLTKRNSYPLSYAAGVGNVYLNQNNKNIPDWVNETKEKMIDKAIIEAKKYAQETDSMFYAIDNMHFQVVHDEESVNLYFDCNVIAW